MPKKYMGRGDTPEPWEAKFLLAYAAKGGISLCAREAGTTWQAVKRHAEENERFASLLETAKMEMCENLERKLTDLSNGQKGNFLAIIARLKAEIPHKYQDKLQVAGAFEHTYKGPPQEELNALLHAMLRSMSPESKAEIVEGTVKSLPELV